MYRFILDLERGTARVGHQDDDDSVLMSDRPLFGAKSLIYLSEGSDDPISIWGMARDR